MGIHPHIFGPYIWASIHLICLGAPKELDTDLQSKYNAFFNLLPSVLPCKNCARHLSENLHKVPFEQSINSSATLFEWSVKLHNIVNSQLNKQQVNLEDARTFWSSAPQCTILKSKDKTSYTSDNSISRKNLLNYLIAIIFGIIIGFVFKSICSIPVRKLKN